MDTSRVDGVKGLTRRLPRRSRPHDSTRSERPQNQNRDHPRPSFPKTTRLNKVKPPRHDGTPRSRLKLTNYASTRSSASARIDNTISIVSVKPVAAYVIAARMHATNDETVLLLKLSVPQSRARDRRPRRRRSSSGGRV